MIKSILVALDGSAHSQAACRYTLWLAERMHATVLGLHVVDVVSIEGSGSFLHDVSGALGFEPYLDFSSKLREVLHERGRTLLDGFLAQCNEQGLRANVRLESGIVANELCEHARTADLVVIGHRGVHERFSTGLLGSTTESITRKCPRPVLVAPEDFAPITHPLLAYDGSERAAAAMHQTAELAAALQLPLTVLHVSNGKHENEGTRVLDEARRYLESYELTVETVGRSGHANEVIVELMTAESHDLLAIGAYGHRRIIEMVLGSTTEYVLRNTSAPVFLCR